MARKGNGRWLVCNSSGCVYVFLAGGGKLEFCFAPDELLSLAPGDKMGSNEDATVERSPEGERLIVERLDANGQVIFRAAFSREGFRRAWKRVQQETELWKATQALPAAAAV